MNVLSLGPAEDLKDAPDVFTTFKNQVEPEMAARVNEVPETFRGAKKSRSAMGVRPCLPELQRGQLPFPTAGASLDFQLVFEPEWKDRPFSASCHRPEVIIYYIITNCNILVVYIMC